MTDYKDTYKKIKPETVQLIRKFIEEKKAWNKGSFESKMNDYRTLLTNLCAVYKVSIPQFFVNPKDKNLKAMRGFYNPANDVIGMHKFSLVTFLHEFKHMLQHKTGKINDEEVARGWSVSLFYQASPKAYERAVRKGLLLFK